MRILILLSNLCKSKSSNDVTPHLIFSPGRESLIKPRNLTVDDDDSFNIHTVETVLGSLGYKCDTAFNGKIALDYIQKKHQDSCCEKCSGYDLIIMDLNMLVMDGLEATRQIRDKISEKEWRDTVIVGCSAYLGEEKKREGKSNGVNDCINKLVTTAKIDLILTNQVLKITISYADDELERKVLCAEMRAYVLQV